MKKLSIFLLATSLFAFVACGGSKQEESTEGTETTVNEAEKAVEAAPATDTAMAAPAATDSAK